MTRRRRDSDAQWDAQTADLIAQTKAPRVAPPGAPHPRGCICLECPSVETSRERRIADEKARDK